MGDLKWMRSGRAADTSSSRPCMTSHSQLVLTLATMPPLVVASVVWIYGLNVPHADQWELVPLLKAASEGTLTISLLWSEQIDHRQFLPRLVMLGLASLTAWDIRYELLVNLMLALIMFAVLVGLLRRTVGSIVPASTPWLILAASLSTFSLSQWHNWVWGWQISIFMNVLAAVLLAWALVRHGRSWTTVCLGLLAAIGGALSFATGFVLLLLLPLAVALLPWRSRASRTLGTTFTVAVAGVAFASYVVGLGNRAPELSPLTRPWPYARFVVAYLGASLGSWSLTAAMLWGILGLAMYLACATYLWVRCAEHRVSVVPWLMLGLYAMLSAAMTGVGRLGLGEGQALAPRYVTISSFFWLGLAVLATLVVAQVWKTGPRRRRVVVVALAGTVLAGAVLGAGRSWAYGLAHLRHYHALHVQGRDCVRRYSEASNRCLQIHYPSPPVLRERARWLEEARLSLFAEIAR